MVLYRHRQTRCKFSNKSPKRKENITPWCFLRPLCSSSLPTGKLRPSAVAQAYCLALRQRPVKRLLASKHLNIQTHPNTTKATYYRNYFETTAVCKEWPTSNTCFFLSFSDGSYTIYWHKFHIFAVSIVQQEWTQMWKYKEYIYTLINVQEIYYRQINKQKANWCTCSQVILSMSREYGHFAFRTNKKQTFK